MKIIKKIIVTTLLSLSLAVTFIPIDVFAINTVDKWDGTVDTSWYDNHENDSEYHITTAKQLAGIAKLVNDKTVSESFKGKTINQRIRECQSQDEFNELLGLLVSMIFTMLDPTRLELSLDLKWNYEEKIIKNILNKIDKNCFKNLYFHKDISSMLFEGLAYRGIVYLLKERIERDEKI